MEFGTLFNQSVDYLPSNLTHLKFGSLFNKSVDFLPLSLTHLTFGSQFNQSVNSLPSKLVYLEFNQSFNQPIDDLPNSIIKIKFNGFNNKYSKNLEYKSNCFNMSLNSLPSNVKTIWFNYESKFNLNFDNLPDGLENLILSKYYRNYIQKIPLNLKNIKCSSKHQQLYQLESICIKIEKYDY